MSFLAAEYATWESNKLGNEQAYNIVNEYEIENNRTKLKKL